MADQIEPPSIELHGVDFWDFRGSRLAATGHSHRVFYLRESGETDASQVAVLFPSREHGLGERWSGDMVLNAPTVHGNPLEQRADARGGLRLTSESGDRATSERGWLRGRDQIISGNDPVHVWGRGYDLQGPRFRLDLSRDRFQFGAAHLTVAQNLR
jgi:hypothetical protein